MALANAGDEGVPLCRGCWPSTSSVSAGALGKRPLSGRRSCGFGLLFGFEGSGS